MAIVSFPRNICSTEIPYTTSQDATPLPDGMTWDVIFNIRDSVARRWYRRNRERIPLQEFFSAGNLAIAELLTEDFPTDQPTFRRHLYTALTSAMYDLLEKEYGKQGGRIAKTRRTIPVPKRPHVRQEARGFYYAYFKEIAAFVQAARRPEHADYLGLQVEGYQVPEIAALRQVTEPTVEHVIQNARRDIWQWTGETSAQDARRKNYRGISPAQQDRIHELRAQGLSLGTIASLVGCCKTTVFNVVEQRCFYAVTPSLAAAD